MYKILLVDDDADVRRLVKKILERGGHQVVVVDNGLSALNELNAQKYDLLLSDASMPQYSGFDLIRTVRQQNKHNDLLIAMLTGRREKQDIEQAIELGVKDYIVKPIDPEQFLQKIGKILEARMIAPAVININDSAKVDFTASFQSPLKMKKIGLSGFSAVSPVTFPLGIELYLNVDDFDYETLPKAKLTSILYDESTKLYLLEGYFLEMDDEFRQQIKDCLKKYNAA